jgi:hypothetical protein
MSKPIEAVVEDPERLPEEQVTTVRFTQLDGLMRCSSTESQMIEILLDHSDFMPVEYTIRTHQGVRRLPPHEYDAQPIVGIRGYLPRDVLQLKE